VRFGLALGLALLSFVPRPALSARSRPNISEPNRDRREAPAATETTCPTEIAPLGEALLADLPSYYNRARIRSRPTSGELPRTRMLLAGELEVLTAAELAEFESDAIEGFYFSTLDRTYINNESTVRQGFHQLFLTRDAAGWIVLTARSSWGNYPDALPATPPIDSSSGLVAQAARTWLRDCQAR